MLIGAHSPPRRGGVAATPITYREATLIGADGVVSWAKKRPCRSDHPVCAASVALQHCYWRRHPSSARRGMLRLIWSHPEVPTKEDIRDELRRSGISCCSPSALRLCPTKVAPTTEGTLKTTKGKKESFCGFSAAFCASCVPSPICGEHQSQAHDKSAGSGTGRAV